MLKDLFDKQEIPENRHLKKEKRLLLGRLNEPCWVLASEYIIPQPGLREERVKFACSMRGREDWHEKKALAQAVTSQGHQCSESLLNTYLKHAEKKKSKPLSKMLASMLDVDFDWLDSGETGEAGHLTCPQELQPYVNTYIRAIRYFAKRQIWSAFRHDSCYTSVFLEHDREHKLDALIALVPGQTFSGFDFEAPLSRADGPDEDFHNSSLVDARDIEAGSACIANIKYLIKKALISESDLFTGKHQTIVANAWDDIEDIVRSQLSSSSSVTRSISGVIINERQQFGLSFRTVNIWLRERMKIKIRTVLKKAARNNSEITYHALGQRLKPVQANDSTLMQELLDEISSEDYKAQRGMMPVFVIDVSASDLRRHPRNHFFYTAKELGEHFNVDDPDERERIVREQSKLVRQSVRDEQKSHPASPDGSQPAD